MAYATTTYFAIAAVAAAVASTATTIRGQQLAANAAEEQNKVAEAVYKNQVTIAKNQATAQSDLLRYNAEEQEVAAEETKAVAKSDAFKQAKLDDAEMAANRVYFNASGVTIDEGTSPFASLVTQSGYRGMNVAAIRQRGYVEARALESASKIDVWKAAIVRSSGEYNPGFAPINPYGGGSTVLTAVGAGAGMVSSLASSAYSAYNSNLLTKSLAK